MACRERTRSNGFRLKEGRFLFYIRTHLVWGDIGVIFVMGGKNDGWEE